MEWFKILLLVIYGLGVVFKIARASGWQPKPIENVGWYAFGAVTSTLIFLGIWFWL